MGWRLVVGILALVLLVGALAASITVAVVAYDRQSEQLDELAQENDKIEHDHATIGAQFADQSKALEQTLKAARSAYRRGVVTGRRLSRLPDSVEPVALYAIQGYLLPRRLPRSLQDERASAERRKTGYTLRWRGLALFASRRDPLEVWTRQAWPRTRSRVRLGRIRASRFAGPLGVVYAWRLRGRTYAVVTRPERDRTARRLAAGMG